MANGYSWWVGLLGRSDTTRVRQADGNRTNYHVLVISLLLALVAALLLYAGWYMLAAPSVPPV
jgi:hypothetical protein